MDKLLEKYFVDHNAWVKAEFGTDHHGVEPFEPTPEHNRVGYVASTIDINVGDGEEELPIAVYLDLYNLRLMAEFGIIDVRFEPVVIEQFGSLEEVVNYFEDDAELTGCGDTPWDDYYYEGARVLRAKYEVEEH